MPANRQVLVQLDGSSVPGLLLKWRNDETEALVTYEVDGRVETEWIPLAQLSLN